ncbi:hypothetical protein Trydic_g3264 [Trypoxylus dichotomus]
MLDPTYSTIPLTDITTVLLVDSQGRSTFGRFLSVKPDLGLLTSTARTFIQEGVTTEYATQVLGTTLDNGRLYAHLLTKSSRVRYDNDAPTKSPNHYNHQTKKWNLDNGNIANTKGFVKNTDYISPNQVEPFIVFPTTKPKAYKLYKEEENEELKSSPSSNPRQPYVNSNREAKFIAFTTKNKQNNLKSFQNNPQYKNLHIEKAISYKENLENDIPNQDDLLDPSKVREWNNLPTFTVRNEFAPNAYSYLGDFPEFEINTEKSKPTTVSDRKAKLLFRPQVPEKHDLKTVTYTGFADFTTTVGDTVIIFSPSTAEPEKQQTGHVTKIKVEPTLQSTFISTPKKTTKEDIQPTAVVVDKSVPSTIFKGITTTEHQEVEAVKEEETDQDGEEEEEPPKYVKEAETDQEKEEEEEPPKYVKEEETDQEKEEEEEPPKYVKDEENKDEDGEVDEETTIENKEEQVTHNDPEENEKEDEKEDEKDDEIEEERVDEQKEEDEEEHTTKHFSMVLDTSDRPMKQSEEDGEPIDQNAKFSVLANEQKDYLPTPQIDKTIIESTESDIVIFSSEIIQPSETQTTPMLSTPSFEDIAKILASLQAKEMNKESSTSETTLLEEESISSVATEPLSTKSTTFTEEEAVNTQTEDSISVLTGAKTIFFDDLFATAFEEPISSSLTEETSATPLATTTEQTEIVTEKHREQKEPTEAAVVTQKESVTSNEISNDEELSTIPTQETTPEIKNEIETEDYVSTQKEQDEEHETDIVCTTGEKIIATTSYQTYNVLTTFYIPDGDSTSTSIKSGTSISTEIGFQTIPCNPIESSPVVDVPQDSTELVTLSQQDYDTTEAYTRLKLEPTTEQITTIDNSQGTTPMLTTPVEITTERHEVTESEGELTETTTESGEEIELVVKTLYTTFNYLTTYFFNNTSSIATSKTIATNVVTSTIYPGQDESIEPSSVILDDLKTKISFDDLDLSDMDNGDSEQEDEKEDDEENDLEIRPTSSLDNAITSLPYKLKTYFTTYTYFSTIYDGEDDSRVLSRTEVKSSVYTDYIDATPTVEIEPSSILEDLLTAVKKESDDDENIDEQSFLNLHKYNTTITRQKSATTEEQTDSYDTVKDNIDNNILPTLKSKSYSTLVRNPILESSENTLDLSEFEIITNMVTNVRSSTSKGDTKVLENVDKRNVLDDQVFSESNNESEIIPSPTLLLQTSYTTFTYFTTTYHGTTSSDVASSLKTITNVVTETLTPQTLKPEDVDVPITYFTTFTYWTTSVKKNTTIIKSSEKTITNVETATPVITERPTASILPTDIIDLQPTPTVETLYSTFTYYTTSYFNDNSSTVYSSLATSSRVITKTPELKEEIKTAELSAEIEASETNKKEPTGLISSIVETTENSGTKTVLSTDIYGTYISGKYAQVQERTFFVLTDSIEPTKAPEVILKPTGVLSINKGRIVDAEGVSTLFYTTQAIGTYIDDSYAQVIDSTSSIAIDEEKKKLLPTDLPIHRTGLVRIIEGAIIQNDTTTLYHSNVYGTLIGGNYAQVIESTSSFIVGKKASIAPTSVQDIIPGPTKAPEEQIESKTSTTPSPVVIEGSLTESAKIDEENSTENDEEDETFKNTKGKGRPGQKKNPYTQVIRPFTPQRNGRPSFFPQGKRKSASTVTRSDVVPTVTAIPAKPRFSGRKSSSFNNNVISPTSSRRFARPKSSISALSSSTGYGGGRRSSSRIQPTSGIYGSSSKRGGFRSTSGNQQFKSAGIYNLKQRIRPTPAIGFNRFASTIAPPGINDEENELTTFTENPTAYTDEDAAQTLPSTTETSARSRNPLLRFRPGLSRPPTTPRSQRTSKNNKNSKTTTTTPKPKSFSRPIASLQNRPRPPNALFPRRGLFTTTTTPPPEEEEEEDVDDIEDLEHEDADLDESDYDGEDVEVQTQSPSARIGRSFSPPPVQIRPFIRRRFKRQVHYSRFRRPGARTTPAPKEDPTTEATPAPRTKTNRFSSNRRNNHKSETKSTTQAPKRLSPTKASSHGRSQFTLRDSSNNRSTFKRPSSSSSRNAAKNSNSGKNSSSAPSRPTAPKLKNSQFSESRTQRPRTNNNNSNNNKNNNNNNNRENKQSSRRASSRRPVQTPAEVENFVLPSFDGTITVTYQIPTEATIPIVNGKITEYKNIITAKYSTQVLVPSQYTTSLNQYGKDVTVLVEESTGVANNGATQITQFVLNETPTTSVIFTPTYIRGRKTSYSHVIPSTVYAVEEVISTVQPAIAAQAPLANILLSQLLLGNVGFPQPNPLLGFQNPAVPGTPTTEFKTRTTTYVTTVTKATSTVIPLTFRGKEILTTIVDSSTEVITATEFLTDTVVVTPTAGLPQFGNGNQLNSLLVPLLLQQQQQQQQQPSNPLLQQPAGVFNLEQQATIAPQIQNDKYNHIDNDKIVDDEIIKEEEIAVTQNPKPRKGRKRNKKPTPAPTPPPKETSIVTLYVSGRQPGEFTTVLSTYVVGEEQRRKREVTYIPVQPSKMSDFLKTKVSDAIDPYVMPTGKEIKHVEDTSQPTESLESVLGDVNKHISTSTTVDLYEEAPLIPKVKKIDLAGGISSTNHHSCIDCRSRSKRDTNPFTSQRRRVVKKLVSVRPHNLWLSSSNKIISKEINHNDSSSITEYTDPEKHRRIIKIKRKKQPIPSNKKEGYSNVSSKRRRKVVVKKRLRSKISLTPSPLDVFTEDKLEFNETTSTTESLVSAIHNEHEKVLVNTLYEESKLESVNERDGRKLDYEITTESKIHEEEGPTRLQISLDTNDNEYDDNLYDSIESINKNHETTESEEYEDESNSGEDENQDIVQPLPPKSTYEFQFPELSESLEDPALNLKTTVIWSTEYETKTKLESKNKTYTFVVTRVNGDEQFVTSSTEVLPHTKTITLTEPVIKYTTLTILDLDVQDVLPITTPTFVTPENNTQEARWLEEARYNLATRVMSNGVEVIVAGDKSTLPGEPDVKRILPSSIYKPVTLKPSTLSDYMMMQLPQESSNIDIFPSSLYQNQFVTKTCLTTFTFLTTFVENGTTAVSSRKQVISNIATEERNTGKISPTSSTGITLTQYPNLSVGIFPTTYTYFNTIMDGEQPLVVQSKHTITNTVTAADDYLFLLQPSEQATAVKDINTYYSTVTLQKTLHENDETKVVSTEEVITQVVITESIPPKATSVMTSYIALDVEDPEPSKQELTTTDVVKTYFITYTYYNTVADNGHSYVQTNISTSTDVVTEKIYLQPKRTSSRSKLTSTASMQDLNQDEENLKIFATKTYLTTFTSRTTMLSEKPNGEEETVVSSRFRIVENVVTETIDSSILEKNFLNSVKKEIKSGDTLTKIATINGQQLEVMFVANEEIKPTSVLPIEKTQMPELTKSDIIQPSNPSIITGSTIVFVDEDDDPFKLAASEPTPVIVSSKIEKTTTLKNNLNSLLSSEIVTKASKNSKRHTSKETLTASKPTSVTSSKINKDPPKKKPGNKISRPTNSVSDLLSLGSLNINRLTPVLNVMADLLQNNLKKPKKNETVTTTIKPAVHLPEHIKPKIPAKTPPTTDNQSRPIYIPVGGFTDIEVAESQNIATFQINEQIPWNDAKHEALIGKLTHESPLLNGGIPISPGEIITANSDVIVGKPGRVGPRIPIIPLHDVSKGDEIPIGMKPPPLVPKNDISKRPYDIKTIPIRHDKPPMHPILHAPNKDDYVGPPPPAVTQENKYKNDDYIPLIPPLPNNFENPYNIPIIAIPGIVPNESSQIHIQYPHAPVILGTPINEFNIQPSVLNEPIVLPEVIERSTGQPLLVNIQPSQVAFINIPHNRTTALIYGGSTEPHRNGQYFDDPSPYPEPEFSGIESYNDGVPQIASIYSQKHYHGQDHQQVGGVIKVDSRPIVVNPGANNVPSGEGINIRPSRPMGASDVQNVKINAAPISFGSIQKDDDFDGYIIQHQSHGTKIDNTRPALPIGSSSRIPVESSGIPPNSGVAVGSHTEVTLGRPSGILTGSHSGLSQQENGYLGVNVHNTNNLVSFPNSFSSVNATTSNIFNEHNHNGQINNNQQKINNHDIRLHNPSVVNTDVLKPPKIPSHKENHNHGRPPHDYRKTYPRPRPNYTKRPQRPMTNSGIADYMTPPPLQVTELFQDPNMPAVFNMHSVMPEVVPFKRRPTLSTDEKDIPLNNNANAINGLYNINNYNKYQNFNAFVDLNEDLDGDDFDDHNGEMNDAGEVIQESNTRPLRPGQIPIEIQRIRNLTTTSTTPKSTQSFVSDIRKVQLLNQQRIGNQNKNHSNDFSNNFDNEVLHKPIIQKPRPFSISQNPPKNQENNQIISYNHDKIDTIPQNKSTIISKPKATMTTTESNRIQVIWSTSNYTLTPLEEIKKRPPTTPKMIMKPPKPIPTIRTTTIKTIISDQNMIKKDVSNKTIAHSIERPKFTSLPIDVRRSTRKPVTNFSSLEVKNVGTQTEKPFKGMFPKQDYISEKPVLNFNSEDVITTSHRHLVTTPKSPTTTSNKLNLNIGEVPPKYLINKTVVPISAMEVLRPPPPTLNNIVRQPSTEMQPPKTDIDFGGRVDIYKIKTVSTPLPYMPKPSEEMMPPPITTEVVIGMSPPAVTTHRPPYRPRLPSVKPVYSLKLDPPRTTHRYETSTYATTTRQAPRTRRPYTRKPTGYKLTTTRSTTVRFENPVLPNNNRLSTTKPVANNKPIDIWYTNEESKLTLNQNYNRTRPTHNISESTKMSSKSTVNAAPTTNMPSKNNSNEITNNQSNDTQSHNKYIEKPLVFAEFNDPLINRSNEILRDSIQVNYTHKSITSIRHPTKSVTSHGSVPSISLQLEPTPTRAIPQETDDIDIITKGTDMMDMHVLYDIGNTNDVPLRIESSITPSEPTVHKPTKVLEGTPSLTANQKTIDVIDTTPSVIMNKFRESSQNSHDEMAFIGEIQNTRLSNNFTKPNRTVINKIISIKPVSTKYITYTTTSTVTVTETSVVTESGAPASTYTTVITKTKTEKITMVDIVTEVTTLLQPTNIVETITTTVNDFHHTLYGSGTNYGNARPSMISPSIDTIKYSQDDIITDTEAPIHNEVDHDNDSILVVLTDKNNGGVYRKEDKETQVIDEIIDNNEADKILLGGISIASVPHFESPMFGNKDKCNPECRASKNELCQKIEGIMRCICRPGFARMFPDHPCKPTYTYTMKIGLDKYGKEKLFYKDKLADQNSTEYIRLMAITQEALDRMVMQSDLRDIYHGVAINGFERDDQNVNTLLNNFNLQLSDNTEETRLTDIFKRYLRNNNYSLGGTELYSSPETIGRLEAEDFNECSDPLYHDCSEYAHCFNLRGTYTCSCKEGYADLSENILYPGRICSAEIIGCELCNYHGTCYNRGEDQVICECFQWYAGHSCHINLKVLLIALVTLGTILFALLLVCIILTCCRRKPRHTRMANGLSFLPQRVTSHGSRRGTLDRRAMIQDTSSESGQSETNTMSYVQKKPKKLKGALKKPKSKSMTSDTENETNTLSIPDQKDRSLTVMIPRAKYHPAPPTSPSTNLTLFEKRKTSAASSNETKLLSYLDAGPSPDKAIPRKYSSAHTESYIEEKPLSRKTSGALISAGFEVSATVMGNNMGTLGTTCGTEADRSENATLIQKISADLLSNTTGTRSQFNTLRDALIDEDMQDPMANWMDTRITTVSEARSYDETTIQPPTKSFRNDYDSKPSSQHPNDEANTMAERDLGSTFLLPHTHLYKPDRGSDISGFESL